MAKKKQPVNEYGHTPGGYIRYLDKDGKHGIVGEGSHKLSAYELPVCETDKERRNFPGWDKRELDGPEMDAVSEEGTTETRGGVKTNKASDYYQRKLERRFQ